jgi:hypothetical protein
LENEGRVNEEDGASAAADQAHPDPVSLVASLNHWIRRAVLRRINVDGVLASASDLEEVMDIPLNNISYHMRCMEKAGVLLEVDAIPRRGAYERILTTQVSNNQIVALVLEETEADDLVAEQKYRDHLLNKKAETERTSNPD